MKINPEMLLEYCNTEKQTRDVKALIQYSTFSGAARSLGLDTSNLWKSIKFNISQYNTIEFNIFQLNSIESKIMKYNTK